MYFSAALSPEVMRRAHISSIHSRPLGKKLKRVFFVGSISLSVVIQFIFMPRRGLALKRVAYNFLFNDKLHVNGEIIELSITFALKYE